MKTDEPHNGNRSQHPARVWAEERAPGQVLLTWQRASATDQETDEAADIRVVAATVGVLDGVASTDVENGGVLVTYDVERISRPQLARSVRSALSLDDDLKTRGNELIKRIPAYLGLAKSLALDDRVSPVPEAARQASIAQRPTAGATGAMPLASKFIPGLPLITRLHTMLPVLKALVQWSREASPDAVSEHLTAAGLSREQMDRDLATSLEAVAFAREYATETAARAVSAASSAASFARLKSREWARAYAERGSAEKPEE